MPANMRLDGTRRGKHRFRALWRQPMQTRPTSITVIAWILILMAGISLVTTMLTTDMVMNNPAARELMSKSPIPVPVQYAMTYAAMLVMLVSGVAILKGQNWGRWLYVVGTAVGFLVGIMTSPLKEAMIPGFVVFVVVTFFLFRPKANKYFSDTESAHDAQSA
jgi:membrane protease YdiL (CAAX protease family)